MLHYVLQQVANYVCLRFDAEQVVYSLLYLKMTQMRAVRVNQNSKAVGLKTKAPDLFHIQVVM